jgi:hypothetical protein
MPPQKVKRVDLRASSFHVLIFGFKCRDGGFRAVVAELLPVPESRKSVEVHDFISGRRGCLYWERVYVFRT